MHHRPRGGNRTRERLGMKEGVIRENLGGGMKTRNSGKGPPFGKERNS